MSIPFVLTTSPHIPCLRRVPFDTTKRNQKSPLGAGPSICIARIASRVAPDLLPCQPRRNIGPRRWTETHALLCTSPLERHFERIYIGFPFARSSQLKPVGDMDWRYQFQIPGFCRGDRPVALEFRENSSLQETSSNKHNAGKMTIGSHKGTKGKAAISGQIEGKGKTNSTFTSPHIPCLRRVPFETEPKGRPPYAIARIASRVARNSALPTTEEADQRDLKASVLKVKNEMQNAIWPGDVNSICFTT